MQAARENDTGHQSPAASTDRHHRQYNFRHFLTKHVVMDLWRTARAEGIPPGEEAPDFEMDSVDGKRVRLSSLRGRPVLVRFGSFT